MKKKISLALAFVMLFTCIFGTGLTSYASINIDEAIVATANKPLKIETKYDDSKDYKASHCWVQFTPDSTSSYVFKAELDVPDDESMIMPLIFKNKESAKKLDTDAMPEMVGVIMGDLESDDLTLDMVYNLEKAHTYYIDVVVLNFEETKAEPTATLTITKHSHTFVTDVVVADMENDGIKTVQCSDCMYEKSSKEIPSIKTVSLSATELTYNGKNRKPSVTVKDRKGKALVKGTDYTVTYPKKSTKVGKYTVTIKFKGDYKGTVKKTFKIMPKGTKIAKLTSKSKGFDVKWNKQSAQTDGYQVQYSTNKSFKNAKTFVVAKNKTTKSFNKLKAKKKYFVRVRTYKVVDGKKYYSKWSGYKIVTTKK